MHPQWQSIFIWKIRWTVKTWDLMGSGGPEAVSQWFSMYLTSSETSLFLYACGHSHFLLESTSSMQSALQQYHKWQMVFWLVVSTPLKNISQMGWLFPIHMENKKCSKLPTRYWCVFWFFCWLRLFESQENPQKQVWTVNSWEEPWGGPCGLGPRTHPSSFLHPSLRPSLA